MKQCPNCNKVYDDPQAQACDDCGIPLRDSGQVPNQVVHQQTSPPVYIPPQVPVTCKCGWTGSLSEAYCPDCGRKLEASSQGTFQAMSPPGNINNQSQPPPQIITQPPTPQPFLELVFSDSTKLTIKQFPRILGRNDVLRYPNSDYVSSIHVTFSYENGKFFVEDTRS